MFIKENRLASKCLICGSEYNSHELKGLLKCPSCGFVTADLRLSDDELRGLYGKDYFHGLEYSDYLADKISIQKNLRARLYKLMEYVGEGKTKKLFEIGAAYGFFLELAKAGFERVAGIDISSEAVNYARETLHLDVTEGDLMDYSFDVDYDVFCMWDTIEHLRDPHLYIEEISNHIKENGLIAITTSDIDSLNARIRGRRWRQIHPPTHLHYFSFRTLKLLLERHGFEIIHKEYPGNYRSLDSIFYIILALRYGKKRLYDAVKATGLLRYDIYTNLYDLMYVIARRK